MKNMRKRTKENNNIAKQIEWQNEGKRSGSRSIFNLFMMHSVKS